MNVIRENHHFQVKWATSDWELTQAHRIRNAVFCIEQEMFDGHDFDEHDGEAYTLVAVTHIAGMPEKVVGTVRIHRISERIWYGSRLAVDKAFRREGVLGAALIELAVRSAVTLGCDAFYATVQKRNEKLFRKLNWIATQSCSAFGKPHVAMSADLSYYPILSGMEDGFWVEGRSLRVDTKVLNQLSRCWVGEESYA
ncbi:MSMEG_0567/Sll0786 family nitrogen starvation N-acetyltransferase [Vibrio mangrovi]|uniref:Acetyltransferase (GNAT) family protein n=1 Tax=Vibrio mangrovi TaxID=474394 RepID=A0A1Y6J057_9VIBR|nr:MSMEG_0567/Sll0786 family nitrogen starvation N-acetyltransferase [Vibrio mangrovi]MDW6005159.1 GNAT family N-acetyltransferase [Vibrio mangrovi]SMS02631.1 Acetyltransferase (GNAT) family protein [Vibrio mangrovi]